MKKIVLISVGQPATNPRLVKEADSLAKDGFDVYVVYTYWTSWAWEADKTIFSKASWTPVLAGGSPFSNNFLYLYTLSRLKIFSFIAKYITLKFRVAEIANGRTYPELLKKSSSIKADLYIAHVLSALPVAVNAAKKNGVKCGFDAEDFHRQEVSDDTGSFHFKIVKFLEDKYLPRINYFTTASPLIAKEYEKYYPHLAIFPINNVFESDKHITISADSKETLRLFWFSQTVGSNRGLDDIITALQVLKEHSFELNLLGNAAEDIKNIFIAQLKDSISSIKFHDAISPDKIIRFATQFDIGLALENRVPLNRDICLTNKIFTYIQSGLAIVASDTLAQSELLAQHPDIGKLYQGGNAVSLADTLLYYIQNRDKLMETRKAALLTAHKQLNWELESHKFLNIVHQTIGAA